MAFFSRSVCVSTRRAWFAADIVFRVNNVGLEPGCRTDDLRPVLSTLLVSTCRARRLSHGMDACDTYTVGHGVYVPVGHAQACWRRDGEGRTIGYTLTMCTTGSRLPLINPGGVGRNVCFAVGLVRRATC